MGGQPWSNFGLEFRPGRSATQEGCDLVLLSGFYLQRHDVTDYIHDVMIVRFVEILNYFENESRSVLIGFGKCEIFESERFPGKTEKLRNCTTVFPKEQTNP